MPPCLGKWQKQASFPFFPLRSVVVGSPISWPVLPPGGPCEWWHTSPGIPPSTALLPPLKGSSQVSPAKQTPRSPAIQSSHFCPDRASPYPLLSPNYAVSCPVGTCFHSVGVLLTYTSLYIINMCICKGRERLIWFKKLKNRRQKQVIFYKIAFFQNWKPKLSKKYITSRMWLCVDIQISFF